MFSLFLMRYTIHFPLFLWVANTGIRRTVIVAALCAVVTAHIFSLREKCVRGRDSTHTVLNLQALLVNYLIKPSGY